MSEISEKEVFAAAAVLLGRVNAPEQAIYSAARAALEAAAHARAEAVGVREWGERIARAWASIDGKSEQFDLERNNPNLAYDDPDYDGVYCGYLAEAHEIIERSGLASALAHPAVPEAVGVREPAAYRWRSKAMDWWVHAKTYPSHLEGEGVFEIEPLYTAPALAHPAVPEGWRTVPVRGNWEMLERLREVIDGEKPFDVVADALEYVLSVSPEPDFDPEDFAAAEKEGE